MLTVTLPWPPTVNTMWRSIARPHRNAKVLAAMGFNTHRTTVMLSAEGKRFREVAIRLIRDAMWDARCALGNLPLNIDVSVTLRFYPPDKRTRDLDNLLKAIFDACTHAGLWCDDNQVAHFDARRFEVRPGGEVAVEVKAL
jgi:crossover junction endodeoxyribonuclease RusA